MLWFLLFVCLQTLRNTFYKSIQESGGSLRKMVYSCGLIGYSGIFGGNCDLISYSDISVGTVVLLVEMLS